MLFPIINPLNAIPDLILLINHSNINNLTELLYQMKEGNDQNL